MLVICAALIMLVMLKLRQILSGKELAASTVQMESRRPVRRYAHKMIVIVLHIGSGAFGDHGS